MNSKDWQIRVDSIDLGDMRLYHAYAFNEKTQQIIEGDTEHPDEAYVRAMFEQQLAATLMQLDMEAAFRARMKASQEQS